MYAALRFCATPELLEQMLLIAATDADTSVFHSECKQSRR